ncbi:putative U1 small nuclear ribonucleoparticle-associated protein [Heterostelium album PN500]|uniref:Putative U1 small nuclear ribonucleoparticle-associated protein n=1 Tax=Heterostelium pallidum (strain ATCC 26659 / Pp 5 / PN500) TaxID=670386 RepID=D3BVK2_HETP5|nr:putative U1 small nuclear ribonucleoparticle-associated protein [Heterostelium album PN500]EFA74505.1 putative U1 small nuclear ribonucleoparticle-associated protein [Heterostelium album PN500]|eukprot:XP_020426639.1 putative U1 small nuclear ribonucleoparticle-associated protein [Heterostelium album PN500]
MSDAIRAQLDELLGKDRNMLPKERAKRQPHFSDHEICKYFLCGLCPNELFTNTNIRDLGPCTKLHDEDCLKQYNASKDKDQYDYERDWVRLMDQIITDNDKKYGLIKNEYIHEQLVTNNKTCLYRVKKNKERLILDAAKLAAEEGLQDTPSELKVAITQMEERIQALLKKSEELGEEGQITEAQDMMTQAEDLKKQKAEMQIEEDARSHDKKMSVCDICGALLFVGDKEKRSMSHLEGKKHVGYAKLRAHMEEYYKTAKRDYRLPRRDNYNNNNRDYNNNSNRDNNSSNNYRDRDGRRSDYGGGGSGGGRYRDSRDRDSRDGRDSRGSPYSRDRRGGGDYNREYRDRDSRNHREERDRERDRERERDDRSYDRDYDQRDHDRRY